jgi:hypothetical protein
MLEFDIEITLRQLPHMIVQITDLLTIALMTNALMTETLMTNTSLIFWCGVLSFLMHGRQTLTAHNTVCTSIICVRCHLEVWI